MNHYERKLLIERVLEGVGNQTALHLAGLSDHELHHALTTRIKELGGMLEITPNLPEYAAMVAYLRSHRKWLQGQLQELERG